MVDKKIKNKYEEYYKNRNLAFLNDIKKKNYELLQIIKYINNTKLNSLWRKYMYIFRKLRFNNLLYIKNYIFLQKYCEYCLKEEVNNYKCIMCGVVNYCNNNCLRKDKNEHNFVCIPYQKIKLI